MSDNINIIRVEVYTPKAYKRWLKVHSPKFRVCIEELRGRKIITLIRDGYKPKNGVTYIEGGL